jgi:hypothetical protein
MAAGDPYAPIDMTNPWSLNAKALYDDGRYSVARLQTREVDQHGWEQTFLNRVAEANQTLANIILSGAALHTQRIQTNAASFDQLVNVAGLGQAVAFQSLSAELVDRFTSIAEDAVEAAIAKTVVVTEPPVKP